MPIDNAGRPRTFEMLTPAARYSRRDISHRASRAAALSRLSPAAEPRIPPAADPVPIRAREIRRVWARKTRHNSRAANGAARRLPCRQEVGVC